MASGHPSHGAQRGQIPSAAHGIGAIELDVVGVVLDAIHDARLAFVPAARPPGVGESALGGGPLAAQPGIVAGEDPIEVELDDLTHLAVRGSRAPVLKAQGKLVAKVHVAFGIGGVAEVGLAHGAGQRGKEKLSGHLVVPHVGAGAETQARLVSATLKAMKTAVRNAEAGVRDECAQIDSGRILYRVGQCRALENCDELPRSILQFTGRLADTYSATAHASLNRVQ